MHRALIKLRALGVALSALTASVAAQVQWSLGDAPPGRVGQIAYDPVGKVVYAFGGNSSAGAANDLWRWDGTAWTVVVTVTTPPTTRSVAVAWDTVRSRLVACGRFQHAVETWEFDGRDWARAAVGGAPDVEGARMAFDPVRRRTVRFGGRYKQQTNTWEWDGSTWRSVRATTRPPARIAPGLAWDPIRKRVVMFGGTAPNIVYRDHWEYDGSQWAQVRPSTLPSARFGAAMRWDSGRGVLVLFGGATSNKLLDDVWEWTGTSWSQRATTSPPAARLMHGMAYDANRKRIVVFGGYAVDGIRNDTWEYDGTRWTERQPNRIPSYVTNIAIDPISQRAMMVGGVRQTLSPPYTYSNRHWEWRGDGWYERKPTLAAPQRAYHALATDLGRSRVVLFGGRDSVGLHNETWEWDGTNWSRRTPATRPPPRAHHAMAYDLRRQRIVLFGGHSGSRLLNDTWEYDGRDWRRIPVPASPLPRRGHSLAYDITRGVIVLHGGDDQRTPLGDTWEWDGTNWTAKGVHQNVRRMGSAMTYDRARQRMVLSGGHVNNQLTDKVFEWDGSNWHERVSSPPLPARSGHAMGYDAATRRVLAIGGNGRIDTWTLRPIHPARVRQNGLGCAGSAGLAALTADGQDLPWTGSKMRLRLVGLPIAVTSATFLVGASNLRWGAGTLPLDLRIAGMPGCLLATSVDAAVSRPASGGRASFPLSIPTSLWLHGRSIYLQGLVLDRPANAAGAVLSNSIELQFGGR